MAVEAEPGAHPVADVMFGKQENTSSSASRRSSISSTVKPASAPNEAAIIRMVDAYRVRRGTITSK